MRESDIEDYLKKIVRRAGGEMRKIRWIGRKNAPDDLVLLPHFHPLVECKAPGKKPTLNQLNEHNRLRKAGFFVFVIDSFAAADRLIEGRHGK